MHMDKISTSVTVIVEVLKNEYISFRLIYYSLVQNGEAWWFKPIIDYEIRVERLTRNC